MNPDRLRQMSISQLHDRFIEIALAQDEAHLMDEYGKHRRLFRDMEAVEDELRSREGDQRRTLLPLFNHPNEQVRLKAAKATLAIAPVAARAVLETIAGTAIGPQALEAGMSLSNLDRGVFKPT